MVIEEQTFGKAPPGKYHDSEKAFPNGEIVRKYTLTGSSGLTVVLMSYGASLISVKAPDRLGNAEELTLGFDSLDGYLGDHPYFGATVGRYANRIRNGEFTLSGRKYSLARNENGRHHLHGGSIGFNRRIWRSEPSDEGVTFSYFSPENEEGYPGNLRAEVSYTISAAGELKITYSARTDSSTPVNLTNHTYWNLAGEGTILDHEIKMRCRKYLPVDEELIPTGEIAGVRDTPMDFSGRHPIGSRIDQVPGGGYDHCYVVDKLPGSKADVPIPVLTVWEPKSGRRMDVTSTQPGVQLYTGNFLKDQTGRKGVVYQKHHGFCVETQAFPDAVNKSNFPPAILTPDAFYRESAVFRFSTFT